MPFPTIAETIAAGTEIGAYCGAPCWHRQMLDLDALGKKLGFDFIVSAATIRPLLRCTKCGRKGCTISVHDTYKPIPMYDTHGNIGEKTEKAPTQPKPDRGE